MSEPFNPAQPDLPPLRPPQATGSADDEARREQERDRRMQARELERLQHVQREPTPASDGTQRRKTIGVAVVVVLAVALGLALWIGLRSGGSSSTAPTTSAVQSSPPVRISVKALKTLGNLGIAIYWAGERKGFIYELTKKDDGSVVIRYLPDGVPVGVDAPYLTVGTYPVKGAFGVTSKLARQNGSVRVPTGKNRVAFYSASKPTNVYLADKGVDYQVEIFDPSGEEAQTLVTSGKIDVVR